MARPRVTAECLARIRLEVRVPTTRGDFGISDVDLIADRLGEFPD